MLLLLCAAKPALAERADSKKPLDVKAEQMAYDDAKQVSTFTGNVVMARGTLLLKAGSVKLTQDAAGYQFASLAAGGNSPASFRQKRDGGDFWVEGRADRIEYDGKTELVKFYSRARLTRLEGHLIKDEITGEVITYDSRNEVFSVETNHSNANNGDKGEKSDSASAQKGKRVTTVIQPRVQDKQ
ncbi:MAG: lipopolysaccharide transport periplasmic protein LptA [Burkholderiales bacterium]|nr:lipopolysaccharide transport periplasmic protein LptA [Burkholderiales bacterium]